MFPTAIALCYSNSKSNQQKELYCSRVKVVPVVDLSAGYETRTKQYSNIIIRVRLFYYEDTTIQCSNTETAIKTMRGENNLPASLSSSSSLSEVFFTSI